MPQTVGRVREKREPLKIKGSRFGAGDRTRTGAKIGQTRWGSKHPAFLCANSCAIFG